MAPESTTVLPYDPAKANQLLDAAGYAKGADGFRTNKDGSPLAITFSVQADYIDFRAMADVVVAGHEGRRAERQGHCVGSRTRSTSRRSPATSMRCSSTCTAAATSPAASARS